MKYPIGIQSFERIIKEGYVYIDKTDMLYQLTRGNIYFLSRHRRFGKSLLVSTLENYFLGKKELFKGLKIDALEKDWKTFLLDFPNDEVKKGYANEFLSSGKTIHKIGVNISSETGTVADWKIG